MQALAILGDIKHDGRGTQLAQLFDHPGANTASGSGDEYCLAGELCAVTHEDFFSSLSLKLTSRSIAALMRALSSAGSSSSAMSPSRLSRRAWVRQIS